MTPLTPQQLIQLDQELTINPNDQEVIWTLELLTFKTGPIADTLRKGGYLIPKKIEAEQRCVMLWCFALQKKFGPTWKDEGDKLLKQYADY